MMTLNFNSAFIEPAGQDHDNHAAVFLKDYILPGTRLLAGRIEGKWAWTLTFPTSPATIFPSEIMAITNTQQPLSVTWEQADRFWTLSGRPFGNTEAAFTKNICEIADFPLESLYAICPDDFVICIEVAADDAVLPGLKGSASRCRIAGTNQLTVERMGRWLDARPSKISKRDMQNQLLYLGFDELPFLFRPPFYDDRSLPHLLPIPRDMIDHISARPSQLLRGLLIAGNTGSGKSTTVKSLLSRIASVPSLRSILIFDIKGEYQDISQRQYIKHLTVGRTPSLLAELGINPFIPSADIRLGAHIETLSAIISIGNASGGAIMITAYMKVVLEEFYFDLLQRAISPEKLPPYPFEKNLYLLNLNGTELKCLLNGQFKCFDDAGKTFIGFWNSNSAIVMSRLFRTAGHSNGRHEVEDAIHARMAFLATSIFQFFCFKNGQSIDHLITQRWCISFQGLSKTGIQFLASTICLLAFEAILAGPQSADLKHLFVLEESHLIAGQAPQHQQILTTENLLADIMERAVVEMRSTGTSLIFVDQQPHSRLIPAIVSNTAMKICHHLEGQDADIMAMAMGVPTSSALGMLAIGQAFVKYESGQPPVKVRIQPS